MEEQFEVYEFRYIDKKSKQGFCIYARTEETAQEIIDIENSDNFLYHFIKPKFKRFKRKYLSEIPPYELEQEQFEVARQNRQKRLTYIATHGGII